MRWIQIDHGVESTSISDTALMKLTSFEEFRSLIQYKFINSLHLRCFYFLLVLFKFDGAMRVLSRSHSSSLRSMLTVNTCSRRKCCRISQLLHYYYKRTDRYNSTKRYAVTIPDSLCILRPVESHTQIRGYLNAGAREQKKWRAHTHTHSHSTGALPFSCLLGLLAFLPDSFWCQCDVARCCAWALKVA